MNMTWRAMAIGLLFAIPLAASIYGIPVQASEVTDIIQYVGDTPSAPAAFSLGLRASRTMLRPMRQLHTKLLLALVEWRGGGYHAVFRGVHAALAVLLVLLFALAARPASAVDLSALGCSLAVLVGLGPFSALFREAYPVNHFLVVTLYGWVVLLLAQRGRGLAADLMAVACVALALLTLESGILVAVVAVAAHLAGWRGVSRRGLALIAAVVAAYAFLRVGYLGIGTPPFAERDTGFGFGVLTSAEQVARFDGQRGVLYAYNVLSGVSTILFSQPTNGTWTHAAALRAGTVRPWMVVQGAASIATTAVIVACAVRRRADGGRAWCGPYFAVPAVVIVANAVIAYSYAKDEIIAFAGTFYALAAYAAFRTVLARLSRADARAMAGAVLACAVMMLWATRVAALHVILREQAYSVRNDWVDSKATEPVAGALRSEALRVPTISPRAFPRWVPAWLGER